MIFNIPRVIIAGLGGDSGKTLLTLGLIANLKDYYKLAIFKKGPDFIDPLWLGIAGDSIARNLDTYIMGKRKTLKSFIQFSESCNFAIIEGNRGLYDGLDEKGTHSTAELAKIVKAPVIIIINASKITRTIAAIVYGCKFFDKKVDLKGVVLNNVSGKRHLNVITDSIEKYVGIPVIGSIPKILQKDILPSRHLGLVTPVEYDNAKNSILEIKKIIKDNVDIESVIKIAKNVTPFTIDKIEVKPTKEKKVIIGIFKDKAFSFYYPENIEALEQEGAEIVYLSSIENYHLNNIDGLYIGGGFPESNINDLTQNEKMLEAIKEKAKNGLPIYAECGGLLYLAEEIEIEEKTYRLSGILPIKIKMNKKPQGHGYTLLKVDKKNSFFRMNKMIKAHEFHYSNIENNITNIKTCMEIIKGAGAINNRDGILFKNVFGTYQHIHSTNNPEWARNFVKLAYRFKNMNN